MSIEDAFSEQIVVLGEQTDAPEIPRFDLAGQLILESGETTIRTLQNIVRVFRQPKDRQWVLQRSFEVPASIVLTNRRIVYSWPNYKSDRSSGSFVERRVMTAVLDRADGKMLPASQIRHCWTTNVARRTKLEGTFKKRPVSRAEIHFDLKTFGFQVQIVDLEAGQADTLADTIAEAVAKERIERRGPANAPLNDEQAVQLAAVSKRAGSKSKSSDLRDFFIPSAMYVPFDYKPEPVEPEPTEP